MRGLCHLRSLWEATAGTGSAPLAGLPLGRSPVNPTLLEWLGSCAKDPLRFVLGAFPWGEPGELAEFTGPGEWQVEVLNLIRDGLPLPEAIRIAVSSGRGIGKSALIAWIILWSLATLPMTKGKVTANTESQLKTVTWPELGKWFRMFIGRELFKMTATALFAREHEEVWRFDMARWSKDNTEAFQGMHNKGRRMVVLFDEASGIPDNIWEVTEGSLTDANTQMIWCAFSNPTKNTGRFRECFPGQRREAQWHSRQIDSRDVAITDKRIFSQWIKTEGEDSDFVRIHVRGIFPRVGEMEFISSADVAAAGLREALAFPHDPLILGVDVARYGANASVICIRKGRDARTIPWLRFRGLSTTELAAKVVETSLHYRADAVFIDGGGVGGGVVDQVRAAHIHCFDINFGSKPDAIGFATGSQGEAYANKRAEMWGAMRAWLRSGGAIPDAPELRDELVGPSYVYNLRHEIQLEKKEDMMKRGVESPDQADALALTFALPVSGHASAGRDGPMAPLIEHEYDPLAAWQKELAA